MLYYVNNELYKRVRNIVLENIHKEMPSFRSLLFFIGLVSLAFISCKEKSPEQEKLDQLHKEVMFIHDDVMPKMGNMHNLKKSLRKSLHLSESPIIDSLEIAEDAMMDWMHEYDKPTTDEDFSEYLAQQKKAISIVRDKMLSAIAQAENALSQ